MSAPTGAPFTTLIHRHVRVAAGNAAGVPKENEDLTFCEREDQRGKEGSYVTKEQQRKQAGQERVGRRARQPQL